MDYEFKDILSNDPLPRYNLYDGVELWLSLGGLPEKMVLGIPSYGRGFLLADPQYDGAFCPAVGPLPAGTYTNQSAFWGYNEVAKYQRDAVLPDFLPEAQPLQWKITRDACYQGPFMCEYNIQRNRLRKLAKGS